MGEAHGKVGDDTDGHVRRVSACVERVWRVLARASGIRSVIDVSDFKFVELSHWHKV